MTRSARPKPVGVVIKCVFMAAAFVLTAYLVWGLRSLIVPASVGGLLAYTCRPSSAREAIGGDERSPRPA